MHQHGMSRSSVVVILIIIVVVFALVALGVPALRTMQCGASSMRDAVQLRAIHSAMLVYAEDSSGLYPSPGLIRPLRLDDGTTEPDFSQNHSAPLYSYMVGANHFAAELLISPLRCTEVNPGIRVKDDYNYNTYDPAANSYWDPTFTVRIDDHSIGSNTSYAHLALCGERLRERWRSSMYSTLPVLSTRGTRDGAISGNEYDRSPTLRLHGPKSQWVGNIIFADGHAQMSDSFTPTGVMYTGSDSERQPDNIFAAEFEHPLGPQAAGDAYLGIFTASTEHTVTPVYDPLD